MAYESHSSALSPPGLVYIMPPQCDLFVQDKHPRCASGEAVVASLRHGTIQQVTHLPCSRPFEGPQAMDE
jgi:hypothetical protein